LNDRAVEFDDTECYLFDAEAPSRKQRNNSIKERDMRNLIKVLVVLLVPMVLTAQAKYIGVKACAPCHKGEKKGKQMEIWQGSGHANAFKTLATPAAAEIAKKKGLTKPATEAPECLECHAIDAKNVEKAFDMKDGVQCESCHGAGSGYKSMAVMKDHAKAVAAGMTDFKDDAAIEKACKSCHNEKSPTYKPFKFKEMYAKIAHPTPKS